MYVDKCSKEEIFFVLSLGGNGFKCTSACLICPSDTQQIIKDLIKPKIFWNSLLAAALALAMFLYKEQKHTFDSQAVF